MDLADSEVAVIAGVGEFRCGDVFEHHLSLRGDTFLSGLEIHVNPSVGIILHLSCHGILSGVDAQGPGEGDKEDFPGVRVGKPGFENADRGHRDPPSLCVVDQGDILLHPIDKVGGV